ncbi:MAG: hypothetical protein IIV92_04170 [Schwartzia sp.]|nr:hypothetical protein [Schwartzia sp. (in: firmicutes)]
MIVYLVDYENVHTEGLAGASRLQPDDSVYIFYSAGCKTIPIEQMVQITASGCHVQAFPLIKVAKNAADFCLVTLMGSLISEGYTDFAILSKDKGFEAARDFVMAGRTGHNNIKVVIAKSFEAAFDLHCGVGKQRTKIKHVCNVGNVSLPGTTPLAFLLEEALKASPLKVMFNKIYELACQLMPIKENQQRYMLCLKTFGQQQGQDVYRTLKPILAGAARL